MNCKPGDLALVIRPLKSCPNSLGMVVEVIGVDARFPFPGGVQPGALIRAATELRDMAGLMTHQGWCRQSSLRPIRDPGDDAKDETLQWLPVPTSEGVEA